MGFYELTKQKRIELTDTISRELGKDFSSGKTGAIVRYFSDPDTYIRKTAYLATGKIFKTQRVPVAKLAGSLVTLLASGNHHVRQTTVNAAGEIGIYDFEAVSDIFDKALFDHHHTVRNAVIGSVKKMAEKNPEPLLKWANKYLTHPDSEARKEICHGLELRGRTHPQDVLPLLEKLQSDKKAVVRNMLIHVIGQISYKKGCLETVISALNKWGNRELVEKALVEIVNVHRQYTRFSIYSQEQAIAYIRKHSDIKLDTNKITK
ncbi:MAG: HEAT repeat domain-containing protein [Bacteroidota bacterium]